MVVKCSRNNIYTILHPQFESRERVLTMTVTKLPLDQLSCPIKSELKAPYNRVSVATNFETLSNT